MGRKNIRSAGSGRPGPSGAVSGGESFFAEPNGGRWATEQLLRAMESGRSLSAAELRVAGTLRPYEWVLFDQVLVEESLQRLKFIADIMGRGLVKPVANAMGRTFFQYNKASRFGAAAVSMDGLAETGDERQEFDPNSVPLPIVHKDFSLHLRELAASRNGGEPLDTAEARLAGRSVAETLEDMGLGLISGLTYGGSTIYGVTSHPDRNTGGFGTNGAWDQTAKTGNNILTDVLTMIAALAADGFYGPFGIYVPTAIGTKLSDDFKANSDLTIRQRLMQVEGIVSIQTCDRLTAANVVMVQLTEDVVSVLNGEPLQTIQWDAKGGLIVNFKAMAIQVPLVRSTKKGNCGIYHMS